MAISKVKTIGYSDFIESLCLILDLYDKGDRSSKIDTKQSFYSKQKIYNGLIFERIIDELYLRESISKEFIDGALIYTETLIQFLYSIPIVHYKNKKRDFHHISGKSVATIAGNRDTRIN